MKNEIILFENQNVKLEVNAKDETVWLTQEQMGILFGKSKSTINEHIKNIYNEQELEEKETMSKFGISEFARKPTNYYNLDVIISVGYRVKSKNGVIFRKWANSVLKEYLLKGYAVNQNRLKVLEKTVQLIDIAAREPNNLDGNNAKEILNVISHYYKALDLLDNYDHKCLEKVNGSKSNKKIIYEDCISLIKKLKYNENSELFGVLRSDGLKSIIETIYQTYGGEDLYPSLEEKSANLLYLIIKNHIFIDGNKRIAATLFIYFLNFYDLLYKDGKKTIDNNTLAALTLLVAQSNPKEKETLIDLIKNFLD